MSRPRRWTISVLTIPRREPYVAELLGSLAALRLSSDVEISVVYNWDTRESPHEVEKRLRKAAGRLPLHVTFNSREPTIASGRIQQLNACKTPLICFMDDDITVHGDLFGVVEENLRRLPLGIVGVPSLVQGTDRLFKPRRSTPSVDVHGIRFMTVQGMCIVGYRRLFLDVGGFNPRRRFWGEWTELNLRLWRSGFPTGYAMNGAYLRHWEDAPESPTRNMSGRDLHVLWGVMCTALEYDEVDITETNSGFWQLVEERYLEYAFAGKLRPSVLLSSVLKLAPRLASEWGQISEFREHVRQHPFRFPPFHRLTHEDVDTVLEYADRHIAPYREEAWPTRKNGTRSAVRSLVGRVSGRRAVAREKDEV